MAKAAFLMVVITLGVLSMGFQLLASRLLNPYFGSAIDVWAWLISTFLAAFSCGAILGGWICGVPAPSRHRTQIAISSLAVATLWLTSRYGRGLIHQIEASMAPGQMPIVLSCFLIFFPPIICVSSFIPQCVQHVAAWGVIPGRASGLVYGISTMGNILGVLLTAFVLIPRIPVSTLLTVWAVVAAVALMSLCFLFGRQRW